MLMKDKNNLSSFTVVIFIVVTREKVSSPRIYLHRFTSFPGFPPRQGGQMDRRTISTRVLCMVLDCEGLRRIVVQCAEDCFIYLIEDPFTVSLFIAVSFVLQRGSHSVPKRPSSDQ